MFFSDKFLVSPNLIKDYGAINISLVCDTPLFIDPILIYDNDDPVIKSWYKNIVDYLLFLNSKSSSEITYEELKYYFCFKERKENWLGVSKNSNVGSALGMKFAQELAENIGFICDNDSGYADIHLEKISLINKGVGRDKISDLVTNIIFYELVKYTEKFALKYIDKTQYACFNISKCKFDYEKGIFIDCRAFLPFVYDSKGKKEFIILTPMSILRKGDQEINYANMCKSFDEICESIPNEDLRFQVNKIFNDTITNICKEKEKIKSSITDYDVNQAKKAAVISAIKFYPELYNCFIKVEEQSTETIKEKAINEVKEVAALTYENELLNRDVFGSSLQKKYNSSLEEAITRIDFFKNEIETNSLWKNFYFNGEPIAQEADLQRLFRLCWFKTVRRVSPETNNGNGPVDFQISYGFNDTCNIEFKLASNSKIKNVFKQIEAYQQSQRVNHTIIVIFYFNDSEYIKAQKVVEDVNKTNVTIKLIDCRGNKVSASRL